MAGEVEEEEVGEQEEEASRALSPGPDKVRGFSNSRTTPHA